MKDGNFVAMTKCYFCGESKDILLDRRLKDISHMNGAVIDKEPCPECVKKMEMGIMLIEARDEEETDNPYRTGRLWVIREEAAKNLFTGIDFERNRCLFIPEKLAKQMGLHETVEKNV